MKAEIIKFIEGSNVRAGIRNLEERIAEKERHGEDPKTLRKQVNAVRRVKAQILAASDDILKENKGLFNFGFAKHTLQGVSDFRLVIRMAMKLRYGTQNPRGLSPASDFLNRVLVPE